MRFIRFLLLVSILESLSFADAIAISPGGSGDENHFYNANTTIGYQFLVTTQLTVTALGYYDALDGLIDPHPVGIWDSSGTLLTSATVPSGTTATLVVSTNPASPFDSYGFRFAMIAPLVLNPGSYIIGGYANSTSLDDFWFGMIGATSLPGVTLGQAGEGIGDSLTEPIVPSTFDFADQGFFGPDFLVSEVPEPSSLPLMVTTLGISGWMYFRRARREKPGSER